MIVGLTGGIASGKSTVTDMFRKLGAYIVDADRIARHVVEKGMPALKDIEAAFGSEVLLEDGTLNRAKLGELIFGDEAARIQLNQIVHPHVRFEVQQETEQFITQDPNGIIIHDIPLLFESKLENTVETIIVVYVSEKIQINRLMERNHFSVEEAKSRIASQMPLSEKVKWADYLINNEGSLEQTQEQAREIWDILMWQGRNA